MQGRGITLACDVKRHILSWCHCCWTNGLDHGRAAIFKMAYARRIMQIRCSVDILRV